MQSRSYLFLGFVVLLGLISGFIFSKLPTNYGLDIKGGVRLTYQMDFSKLDKKGSKTPSTGIAEATDKIITIISNRASGIGAAEPTVAAKGEDQIIVELPGILDIDKAKEVIGSSARIELYHARNMITKQAFYREYEPIDDKKGSPLVKFIRRSDPSKIIEPGTPEYKKVIDGWDLILAGQDLAKAQADSAGNDKYHPTMNFSPEGANKLRIATTAIKNKGEYIAFVLDGRVLSIATVKEDTILSDSCFIDGQFDADYVKNLVDLLNAGSLPVDLVNIGSEKVDPTIGLSAYNKIVIAGVVAFGVITAFLLVYYAFPGLVALFALGLYTLFTLTALKGIGATFSLASIAGFILSVGMAVDANILVFERFKEEMKSGKSLQTAIELGFRRALPAIIDSNACTILTSLVLVNLGTGPVKGFATTLIIGVVISLFTAVTVTRSLLLFLVGSGIGANVKWWAVDRNWFHKLEQKQMHIVDKPAKWFLISAITVLIGVPFAFMGGFKLNVEFTGGSEAVYALKDPNLATGTIRDSLEKNGFKGSNVKLGQGKGNEKVAYITIPPSEKIKSLSSDAERLKVVADAAGITGAETRGFQSLGATLSKEVQLGALKGVIISSLLIVVYLAFRFGFSVGGFAQGLKFGLSAVGALVHDILVVIFLAAIVGYFEGWEISALFLTAMLTIIGFSVHDTIVIFDRIRENLRHPKSGEDLAHLMNESIRQSFARSVNTSGTVVATLLIMLFAGTATPDLKFFVLAMLIGIISGTYSSIFNAAPILYLWDKWTVSRKGEAAGLIGLARAELSKETVVSTRVEQPGPQSNTGAGGRTYGQVRRRASDKVKDSWTEID